MIDHDLILESIEYSTSKLDERISTEATGLYFLEDILNPALLHRLLHYVQTTELDWMPETNQEQKDRKKIHWVMDSPIEEMHTVMESLTPKINQIFNKNNKFAGITIWRDGASYLIAKHTDNPVIDVAMQVYLTEYPGCDAGTNFVSKTIIKTPYRINFGYIMDNRCNIEHYMLTEIPEQHIRYSLYALWVNTV